MNIHHVINARSWSDTRRMREQFNMPIEEQNLSVVTIALKAQEYYREYLRSTQYYCHECSSDYRRPVYHRDAPTPFDMLSKYKRTTREQASEIFIIETDYPYFV